MNVSKSIKHQQNRRLSSIGSAILYRSKFAFILHCKLYPRSFYNISTTVIYRFKHKNPEDPIEVPGGYLTDCNKDSLKILRSFADKSLKNVKVYDKFQFERVGFFSVDPDTTKDTVNRSLLYASVLFMTWFSLSW